MFFVLYGTFLGFPRFLHVLCEVLLSFCHELVLKKHISRRLVKGKCFWEVCWSLLCDLSGRFWLLFLLVYDDMVLFCLFFDDVYIYI